MSNKEVTSWIYALSIYQNYDKSKGVTINHKLGNDTEFGPLSKVIKDTELILLLLKKECEIYTRLW